MFELNEIPGIKNYQLVKNVLDDMGVVFTLKNKHDNTDFIFTYQPLHKISIGGVFFNTPEELITAFNANFNGGGNTPLPTMNITHQVTYNDLSVNENVDNATLINAVSTYMQTLPVIVNIGGQDYHAIYLIELNENPISTPLNEIEFATGTAPSILQLETILGITLINPIKTGDIITFDNVGYHIPNNAFASNNNLIRFDVAQNVTAGNGCFVSCKSLTNGFNNLVTAGDGCFFYCTNLTSGFNSLVTAGNGCFVSCKSLTNGFNNLVTAGDGCFFYCTNLTSGFNSLVTAGNGCFVSCKSLTNGFNNLVTAGDFCFQSCTSLTNGFNNLVTAGIGCFQSCTSLTNGFNNLVTAGNFCFQSCTSLTNGFNNLVTAGNFCFQSCTSLTNGFNNLVTAGIGCFEVCTSLTNLNFGNVDNFGSTSGNNNVFNLITNNTITVTAKTIHQTSNGGNLDGDLQYLDDNNTVTFNWV